MVRENIPEYSVSEISNSIKNTLEDTFGYVKVRGEISGLKQAASGHVYFTLKDEKIWCQDNVKLAPYGYGYSWVSNTVHHYCLIFKKE